jgi:hypothetical protein
MTYRAPAVIRRIAIATAGICAAVILLPGAADAQQSGSRAAINGVPLDRWLVSSAFPTDGGTGDSPLTGPGEEGVLPDRGREQAGAGWMLVRQDGRSDLRLDSLLPERESPVFVYAHSYVRLPVDQTMVLSWSGLGDTGVRAWVNGRLIRDRHGEPIEAFDDVTITVRLGGGWNTLLFRSEEAGGAFGFSAALSAPDGGTPFRVQASRPPGDIRTGPAPWILAEPTLRPTGGVAWSEDELSGELMLDVTAWSRTPIDTVEVRLRADGADARGGARWLTPGTPAPVSLWLPLESLERVRRSTDGVEVELKWFDEEVKQRLGGPTESITATPDPQGIRFAGWEVQSVPAGSKPDRIGPAGPLPDDTGWMMSGEWKVPQSLAGRNLYLRTEGAPGDYRLDERAFGESEVIPLCTNCRKGQKIEILARSRGPWDTLPVVVEDPLSGAVP